MPDTICPACGKKNHNVYDTGCPTLARFAMCKHFYDQCPKDKLDYLVKEFKTWQRDVDKQKKDRRNYDKKTLRTLKDNKYHSDDIESIKKTMYNSYINDFRDEEFSMDNPYDDISPEDDSDEE